MNKQTQHGKGLSGFLSGLLLATAAIAGILFFLNKGNQSAFKEEIVKDRPAEQSEPEVLKPQEKPKKAETAPAETTVTPSEKPAQTETKTVEEKPAQTEPVEQPKAETKPQEETPRIVVTPPKPQAQPHQHQQSQPKVETTTTVTEPASGVDAEAAKAEAARKLAEKKAELQKKRAGREQSAKAGSDKKTELTDKQKIRAERKLAEKKAAKQKAEEAKKSAKPTPEQILNSGSIENARKAADEEAKKAAKAETAKNADAKKSEKTADGDDSDGKGSGKKVVLQMGSYADRKSADAQRAKLAMMGVASRVVEGSVNGKSVYRVQSGSLSQDAAKRAQQTLKDNGVNSFARSAQ
ncbi:SPOR domain-containing protein [Neisseria chenwenguii]|uniref:SPOR domain-containing protein n=1 Tax=Neisseria chenwenguii TaxID=1853278 RepID=UPI000F4FF31B|nr:SPOR domain-containing protein [Neisseria chenwenguii]ROV54065.1 SPOR domain-containing protein [Neisseria chenwenguii]